MFKPCYEISRLVPRQRLIHQAGRVGDAIERREAAEARALALAEQDFIQRLEPFAQILELMLLADRESQRLEI